MSDGVQAWSLADYVWDWSRLLLPESLLALGLLLLLSLALLGWWGARQARALSASFEARLEQAQAGLRASEEALQGQRVLVAQLESTLGSEREAHARELRRVLEAHKEQQQAQGQTFEALAASVLERSQRSFLSLAKSEFGKLQLQGRSELEKREQAVGALVKPIRESLDQVQGRMLQLEKAREQAYGQISEQIRGLMSAQGELRAEAGNLVKALRRPEVRGRWGEIQLRKVVEMAGMLERCDFVEQSSVSNDDGKQLRPDLLVSLPGGKQVVVDAKTPLRGFLDAVEAGDSEDAKAHMASHARHVREHMRALSSKAYWNQFENSPEFVVMFLPGENFFSAALEADPGLIEEGANSQVILATPTTLIALLRAVSYGWRQEELAQGAREVASLAKTLYGRLATLAEHVEKLGVNLGRSVKHFNQAVGTLESRVLVSARRFNELGVSVEKPLPEGLSSVEEMPRALSAPELVGPTAKLASKDDAAGVPDGDLFAGADGAGDAGRGDGGGA